jgi:hypothetical protein
MSWVAVGVAGASLVSGALGSRSTRSAARTQEQATQASIAEQRRQFDLSRQDAQPWMQAGQNALGQLQDPARNFMASPGYEFMRGEGMRGIERSAAARGGAASGNALRALSQFNSGLAQQDFGNWWNRTAGLAGVGQAAQQQTAALGANMAGNVGNALMAGGEARASGIMGQANSLTGALNSGLNNYMLARGGWFDRPAGGMAPQNMMALNYTSPGASRFG